MLNCKIKACSVDEIKKIDELAPSLGVDHLILMEDAGSAVYNMIVKEVGIHGKKFLVLAGTGNNGGDALVVARRIYAAGSSVDVFIVGDPGKYRGPAKTMYDIVLRLGLSVKVVKGREDLEMLSSYISKSDLVVVGLIGIGLRGEVSGLYKDVIELINSSGKLVVSVDIPSGIDGNNGRVRGVAVRSNYTVTFGMPKYGNLLYPGYQYCGKLYVSRLSYPPELWDSSDIRVQINCPISLPERVKWGHKGTFGKLLSVAGASYYYGAPYYTSYSFLVTGGGYSRLATPKSIVPVLASKCSQVVYHPMDETDQGTLAISNYEKIVNLINEHSVDIVVLGPGVSTNEETLELMRVLAESIDKPVIIDGDGITAISKNLETLKKRRLPTVLTPHPAEFSRLINEPTENIFEDPICYIRRASRDLNAFIVLKGAHSLIGYPSGCIYINMTGNPGMAKAGTGDILNGIIAALYGMGLRELGEATRMGVLVHGLAGDLAAIDIGEDGITADALLNYIPRAMRTVRDKPEYILENYLPREI
ncbi:MAG: NAD(P)H-hydrate dehydratase [Desulfurococcaceae archaeon]